MKKFILLVLMVFPFLLSAQFGLHATYQKNSQDAIFETNDFPLTGFAFGADYTFRLANNRVEFFPELNYAFSSTKEPILENSGTTREMKNQAASLYFNTNFYIFDFAGDCDCPVFSKDGSFLKKGFFLQISPGVSYHSFEYSENDALSLLRTLEENEVSFSLGGGVGVDVGLSEFITITPYFRARYHLPVSVDGYPDVIAFPEQGDEFSMWQINAGLRLGVQLTDEFTRNKRMRARRENSRNKKRK